MNVLIAIDSFKGSLSSIELADTIESGIHEVSSDIIIQKAPIADGGEGTIDTLINSVGGEKIEVKVKGPLFKEVLAYYGILNDKTAIIEMAVASGLTLVPGHLRNPMHTTTYGIGQLINDAIARGCRDFLIGIGGSATNDAGIGMLTALGYKFLDKENNELAPIGSSLIKIATIDSSQVKESIKQCKFTIACDVDNPFYGSQGAAQIYATQKGADKEEVLILDRGLKNFSDVIARELDNDISLVKGAGAAGGLGGGFKAFLDAKLKPGVEIIFEKIALEEKIKWADIIITGEGRLDHQTAMGKAPVGVGKLALRYNKRVIALAGSVAEDAAILHDYGITEMHSIIDGPMTLEEAMDSKNTRRMLKKKVVEIFRLINKSD
ncbi:MAG: glycerate kinase [Bacteroidetes bacterium]|nr:MAG: glycerate kinase [Bacteroidota bacterium]